MTRMKQRAAVLFAVAFAAGCATQALPPEFAATESAIAIARQAGAAEHAAYELDLAQQKITLGRRFLAERDAKPARWMLEQARVDVELASMKAASARARRNAALMAADFRAGQPRLSLTASSQ